VNIAKSAEISTFWVALLCIYFLKFSSRFSVISLAPEFAQISLPSA